ncbi:hypothetical protein EDD17DRAFT_1678613 [Pisolithus thermaeus]|nr:hypothetical protein EDD17DRAFT_1678613 [Pisolithus thermaeus]
MGCSWERLRLNFLRRYKWAFMHEYEDFDVPPVGHPNFLAFTTSCSVILQVCSAHQVVPIIYQV